jgi:N-acetylglucosamine-6-sulfatase
VRMSGSIRLVVALGVVAAGSAVAPASWGAIPETRAAPSERPNIVVLETDDQTLAELEVLRNVRRLIGDEGVTFDNHFVSFSLCCPSRATFLTGQYSHNNGVRGNVLPWGGFEKLDSANTLAVWLQQAGYYTVHLGKYLNGYGRMNPTLIPPGWSEWRGSTDPQTYRFYGYRLNEGGLLTTYCEPPQPLCYQTDVFRDKANEIILRRAPGGPFFLWVAFLANHSGAPREDDDPANFATPVPAPRHRNLLSGAPLPQSPSFNELDVSDKPLGIRQRPLLSHANVAAIQENWQQRRETLLALDEAVASIVETLRSTGELDETLIVFTTDNGFFHGEHRIRAGKVLWYEPSIHVPLLMRWTGNRTVPRGVHRRQLVTNVDHASTILAAARARAGRLLDGVSLLPLWRDGDKELGRDILIDNTPGPGHFDAIRTRRFKYAEYANGERELYDLHVDPYELQSQHANPAYDAVEAALAARLRSLVTCAGASCRARPVARLRAVRLARCRLFRASVTGDGIERVVFRVNGRRAAGDRRPPFRATLRVRPRHAILRARVEFAFDRVVTFDRFVRRCR